MSLIPAPAGASQRSVPDLGSPHQREGSVRVGLVLSGGGLRGASHVGVLRQLVAHDIPIDVIVGSSAGAVIAAYYAAVGLTLDELIADARRFRGRHLLAHSLNVRLCQRLDRLLGPASGIIPERLEQLEGASFDRLYHGVRAIGIVCHNVRSGEPCYFATGRDRRARVSDVVRASASIPGPFPWARVSCDDGDLRLSDGGVSDCLPIAFARRPPLAATHVIVSDCRWLQRDIPASSDRLVYLRPRLSTTGTLWAPSSTLLAAVRQGTAAVTDEMLDRVRRWRGMLGPSDIATQPAR